MKTCVSVDYFRNENHIFNAVPHCYGLVFSSRSNACDNCGFSKECIKQSGGKNERKRKRNIVSQVP